MLAALKAVYEMLRTACEGHAAKESADKEELKNHKVEIAALKKANEELEAEHNKAIVMIEEIANYLDTH